MNAPANGIRASVDSGGIAPANLSATRPLYWSIQRELWENRYLYVAPLAVAAIFLLANLIGMVHLPSQIRQLAGTAPERSREAILSPYNIAAAFMMKRRSDQTVKNSREIPLLDSSSISRTLSCPFSGE